MAAGELVARLRIAGHITRVVKRRSSRGMSGHMSVAEYCRRNLEARHKTLVSCSWLIHETLTSRSTKSR